MNSQELIELIAEAFRPKLTALKNMPGRGVADRRAIAASIENLSIVVMILADKLETQSKAFDRDQFLKSCGVPNELS